jgi:hypothetical protein
MCARGAHFISPQPYFFSRAIPLLQEIEPTNTASRYKTTALVSTGFCNEIATLVIVYSVAISRQAHDVIKRW